MGATGFLRIRPTGRTKCSRAQNAKSSPFVCEARMLYFPYENLQDRRARNVKNVRNRCVRDLVHARCSGGNASASGIACRSGARAAGVRYRHAASAFRNWRCESTELQRGVGQRQHRWDEDRSYRFRGARTRYFGRRSVRHGVVRNRWCAKRPGRCDSARRNPR